MAGWERPPWLVRIRGALVGGGVLCTDRHIVTCAHVLGGAAEVTVDFPFVDHPPLTARVLPGGLFPDDDVAVLELAEPPAGASPVPLRVSAGTAGHHFRVHGFPRGHDGGVIARGVVVGAAGSGWVQVQAESTVGFAVDRGFSGAPLWDEEFGAVVGIVAAREGMRDLRTGYAIPVEALRRLWPPLRPWVGWRLDHDPDLRAHWGPRSRGVHRDSQPGQHFTGRRAALDRLVAWVTGGDPLHVVTGGPGAGKSSVLARLVALADPARHESEALAGAVSLAFRCTGLDLAGACRTLSRFHRHTADPEELIADLVEQGEPMVVVVDALDEAVTAAEARAIAVRLLRPLADTGLVRVLVGTRPGHRSSLLRALGDAPRTDLDDPAFFDPADLVEHAEGLLLEGTYRAEPAAARRVAEAIARRSGSSFLVAGLTAHARSREPVADAGQSFPTDVDEAMRQYLAQLPDPDRTRTLLRLVAHGRHPGLPLDLWEAVARAYTGTVSRSDLDDLVRTATSYVLERHTSDGEPVYALFHQALTDHLRDLDGGVLVERTITEVLVEDTRTRGGWRHARDYARRHLAAHAAVAGALDDLVTDPDFLVVAERHALVRVLDRVRSPEARAFADVYRAAAHALTGTPDHNAAHLELVARRLGHHAVADRLRTPGRPFVPVHVPEVGSTPGLVLIGTPFQVRAVTWARLGGKPVVVCGQVDGAILCWDPVDGTLLDSFGGKPLLVGLDRVERGGTTVLVADYADGTLEFRDLDRPDRPEVVERGTGAGRVWTTDDLPAGPRGTLAADHFRGWGRLDEPVVLRAESGDVRAWRVADGMPLFTLSTNVWVGPVALGGPADRPVLVTSGNDELLGEAPNGLLTGPRTWVGWDGRFVSPGGGCVLRLWDPSDGREIGRIDVPESIVTDLAWGRWEGRDVLAGSAEDELVRLWDLDGTVLASFPGVAPLAWGEVDGRTVLATATPDGDAQVWDGETRSLRLPGGVTALAWGEVAGRPVLACAGTSGRVALWSDFATAPTEPPATTMTWDPTGRLLAVGSTDGRVTVHGSSSFSAHDDVVMDIAWGAAALATRTPEGEVRLWDQTTGTLLAELPPRPDHRLLFDWVRLPEGDRLVIAASPAEVELWAADGTSRTLDLPDWSHPVRHLRTAVADGRDTVLCAVDNTLRPFDGETLAHLGDLGRRARHLDVDAESVAAIGIIAPGAAIARGGTSGSLTLWSPSESLTWLPEEPIEHAHDGPVHAVVWFGHPDGTRLATGGADGLVKLWNPADLSRPGVITGTGGAVHALTAEDGQLVVGTADGTVRVHRLSDGARTHLLPGTGSAVGALAAVVAEDGLVVAAGCADGVLRLWNTWEDGDHHAEPIVDSAISALSWGHSGEWPVLGLGWADGSCGWWSPYSPDGEGTVAADPGPAVTALAWTADGAILCVGFEQGAVMRIDPTGAVPDRLTMAPRQTEGAMAAGVLDGRAVLAAGGSGTTERVWDVEDGTLVVVGPAGGLPVRWGDEGFVAVQEGDAVRVVDVVSGELRCEVSVPAGLFSGPEVAFGRLHGRVVCAVATTAGLITVVDVESDERRFVDWHEPVLGLAFGADNRLAVLDAHGATVVELR
ncbi:MULTISPECIES: trypsin-like peptidase domain-containing protein [unclassified Saccharothrix]|uniref:trypsin-like peptidase domain-containing protein n=1 Tax=unclassified Saccharothrix TaxID=2593673 RepID=UPI00307E04BA